MTEFQYMIDVKFGQNKKGFTEEEHDQMKQAEEKRKEAMKKAIADNPELENFRPQNALTGEAALAVARQMMR